MNCAVTGYLSDPLGIERGPATAEDFDSAVREQEVCIASVGFEELIFLVVDNFFEFEADLLRLAQKYLVWPQRSHSAAMEERLLLDRRLMNLLTASRTYRDHSEHFISGMFGRSSAELSAVRKEASRLYDSRFGFRFMERLRNFVQHQSLAVTNITYFSGEAKGQFTEFTVKPLVDLQQLKRGGFHAGTLAEALSLDRELDLRGPAREYVASLVELHLFTRRLTTTRFEQSKRAYQAIVEKYSIVNGKRVARCELVRTNDDCPERPVERLPLTVAFFDYHKDLVDRFVGAGNLRLKFASGGQLKPERLPTKIPAKALPKAKASKVQKSAR